MRSAHRLIAAVGVWLTLPALAGDLITTLEVSGSRGHPKATGGSGSSRRSPPARPALQAKVDEPLSLHWTVHIAGTKPQPDVLVHFIVVPASPSGPPANAAAQSGKIVVEGALTMDFGPTNSATGTVSLRIHEPGDYLARVEVKAIATAEVEETLAAVDLRVK
jgi:hypothetical protein